MKRPLFVVLLFISAVILLPQGAKAQLQWTVVNPAPTANNLNSVTYGNGQWVAVGGGGLILTSPDGITWTRRFLDTSLSINFGSIIYGNGRFVAGGGYSYSIYDPRPGAGTIVFLEVWSAISFDGISWTTTKVWAAPYGGPNLGPWSVSGTFGNGSFQIAFACLYYREVYRYFLTSTDGYYWSGNGHTSGETNLYENRRIAFVNSQLAAVGPRGLLELGGTLRFSGTIINLNYTAYGDSLYVVVGDTGTVLSSFDGNIWYIQVLGTTANLYSVTYGNSQFVTVGAGGVVLNSPNGINWVQDSSGTTNQLNSVATDGADQYVAVGNNGTIVVSGTATSPSVPILVSPADGSSDIPITPTLRWGSTARAANYHLQIASDSTFTTIVIEDSALTGSMAAVSVLSDSTVYYWRLRAKNAGGVSAWSEVWSFETGTTGVLPDNGNKLLAFSISGSANIVRYTLASACRVSLRYYDLRGRLAATLVDRTQGAGSYVLSVRDVLPARGLYIRVFQAGSFVKRDLTPVVGK